MLFCRFYERSGTRKSSDVLPTHRDSPWRRNGGRTFLIANPRGKAGWKTRPPLRFVMEVKGMADMPPLRSPVEPRRRLLKPEALGLRRASPLSLRRGAPWSAKLVGAPVLWGPWMEIWSLWEPRRGWDWWSSVRPESGDSRRSPRAADMPPLRGPVEPRRRPLDCGEHRRSL